MGLNNTTKLRRKLWVDQDRRCGWCGKEIAFADATIEHLLPLSAGGSNYITNLICACWQCNHIRKDQPEPPETFFAAVRRNDPGVRRLHRRLFETKNMRAKSPPPKGRG